jgi:hypothetical protein
MLSGIGNSLGPVRRSYSAAIDCRQFPAASARSGCDRGNCISFSASANVCAITSGPVAGAVPKAGGAPGVWFWAGFIGIVAAPSRVREDSVRNWRRDFSGIFAC